MKTANVFLSRPEQRDDVAAIIIVTATESHIIYTWCTQTSSSSSLTSNGLPLRVWSSARTSRLGSTRVMTRSIRGEPSPCLTVQGFVIFNSLLPFLFLHKIYSTCWKCSCTEITACCVCIKSNSNLLFPEYSGSEVCSKKSVEVIHHSPMNNNPIFFF